MKSHQYSPPPFSWDEWYAGLGGREISIPEVDDLLYLIFHNQFPRFQGVVADTPYHFESPEIAAQHIKEKAQEFGADIVGICEIEPTDIYRNREIHEKICHCARCKNAIP